MKKGFTLAEVLITLSVIGLVAALTIPELVKNMTNYAFQKSQEITLAKIKEATAQMNVDSALDGYTSNDAFVDTFQKYMKITKRCDSSTIVNCFPSKIKTATGEDIDTSTLATGIKLGVNNLSSNTVVLMLANGTSMIFTLRDSTKVGTACDRIDPVDNKSDTTSCMSFLYDINGFGSPNIIGKDIATVNATVTGCDGIKVGGLCIGATDTAYAPINTCSSGTVADQAFDPTGDALSVCATNAWAGAKKACAATGMRLPEGGPVTSELNTMIANKSLIGNLSNDTYYSATEYTSGTVWTEHYSGYKDYFAKWLNYKVRCVK